MQRKTATFCLFALWIISGAAINSSQAQVDKKLLERVRVLDDPEGDVKVYFDASFDSGVDRTLPTGSVISIGRKDGDWYRVFDGNYNGAVECIHSSRLKEISEWKQFVPDESQKDSGILKSGGFLAQVRAVPFNKEDHEITEISEGFFQVDGGIAWGTDGGLPKRAMSLEVTVNGTAVPIPEEALWSVYEPNFDSMVILTPGEPADQAMLLMVNSDGAGTYCVIWSFKDGQYCSRTIVSMD